MGSAFHVIPEGLNELSEGKLNEKAKSVVLLMRLDPALLNPSPSAQIGPTTESLHTPRSAPTLAALLPCTNSRPTTFCARATVNL
ncbi:hypothetical protein NicSoilC12_35170 [Arthrobacter sp. NicSoilC12]|nr:hypothetical protein NicSoilC12_35170 [Arthrobacter sp. NicSoilC12]